MQVNQGFKIMVIGFLGDLQVSRELCQIAFRLVFADEIGCQIFFSSGNLEGSQAGDQV